MTYYPKGTFMLTTTRERRLAPRRSEPQIVDPILDSAIGVLERKGWTKRKLHDPRTGEVCVVGAIASVGLRVVGDVTPRYPVAPIRLRAVRNLAVSLGWSADEHGKDFMRFVTHWNDNPKRQLRHVLAALRRAARGR